jgi:diguanylate cyclase (GGDEF)-like protein
VEDIRGRWGGEEFIVAFRHESKETMMGALGRALDEFKAMTFESDDNDKFHLSFSAGVGEYPGDGDSLLQLLRCIDRRLYRAKARGRSIIVMDD